MLSEAAWWEDYYVPMENRLVELNAICVDDPLGEGVLRQCREEIEYYKNYFEYYSYLFLVTSLANWADEQQEVVISTYAALCSITNCLN